MNEQGNPMLKNILNSFFKPIKTPFDILKQAEKDQKPKEEEIKDILKSHGVNCDKCDNG